MAGARITRVVVRQPKLRYRLHRDFVERLERQTVRAVERRAKYLLMELASGDRLLMHLGMSGSFHYYKSSRLEAHDHVIFEMSNGFIVAFNDPRRFGFMLLLAPADHATHRSLTRLGPEPLSQTFDAASLAKALARRKTSLKMALSDQRVVGGLGNIYVVEALHRARRPRSSPRTALRDRPSSISCRRSGMCCGKRSGDNIERATTIRSACTTARASAVRAAAALARFAASSRGDVRRTTAPRASGDVCLQSNTSST